MCAQLTRDLFAIAKFLFALQCRIVIVDVGMPTTEIRTAGRESRAGDGDTHGAGTSFTFYRAMQSQDVCPSICPSHGRILSKRLNIYHTFSLSGSHTVLFFPYKTVWQYSDGDL